MRGGELTISTVCRPHQRLATLGSKQLLAYMANVTFFQSFSLFADFIFPPRCPACGTAVRDHGRLCPSCWSDLVIPGQPACCLCQRPFPFELGESAICAPCMADPPRHEGIAAGTIYNTASRKLILDFKHGGRLALATLFAGLIVQQLPELGGEWHCVPVPLHRWRLWKRGYNQSAVLAAALSKQLGHPVMVDALLRRRNTPSLAGRSRSTRARTLSGAIVANPRRLGVLKHANVILVDDVLTSGATSNACISALKRAGVQRVIVACAARVLYEHLTHAG